MSRAPHLVLWAGFRPPQVVPLVEFVEELTLVGKVPPQRPGRCCLVVLNGPVLRLPILPLDCRAYASPRYFDAGFAGPGVIGTANNLLLDLQRRFDGPL